jgi:hypothetical protein
VSTVTGVALLEPLWLPAASVATATIRYGPSAASGALEATAKLEADAVDDPIAVQVALVQLPVAPAQ